MFAATFTATPHLSRLRKPVASLLLWLAALGLALGQQAPARADSASAYVNDGSLGLGERVWTSSGRVGIRVGVATLVGPLAVADGPHAAGGAQPRLILGLRYRWAKGHSVVVDASGGSGAGRDAVPGYVATTVGLELMPAKSRLGFEPGALGLKLDSGYKLSLKARHGGPVVYLRGQF